MKEYLYVSHNRFRHYFLGWEGAAIIIMIIQPLRAFRRTSIRARRPVWSSKSRFKAPKQVRRGRQEHPEAAQDGPKTFPRPSSAARSEKKRPTRVQEVASSMIGSPFWSIWRPKSTAKRPQVAFKMRPGEDQNGLKTSFGSQIPFFKKHCFPEVKSRFLRVGGTVWEFRIVPQRVPVRIRNDFEEDLAPRSGKYSFMKPPECPKVTIHRPCR